MKDSIEFILMVISSIIIGFSSHIFIENIHTGDSGGVTPPTVVVKPPEPFISETMRVTAYCQGKCCCGKYADGVTASGHKIGPGDAFVAAPKNIPFGTVLVIPGYNGGKPVKVLDRGGAITSGRLDVFFHSHKEAMQFGVQNLIVKRIGE